MSKYNLAAIKPAQLPKLARVSIENQAEIKEAKGSELSILEAYNTIKESTKNFTEDYDLALKADEALHAFIKRKGFYGADEELETSESKSGVSERKKNLLDRIEFLKLTVTRATPERKKNILERISFLELASKRA
jgi:hypothetical protein